MPNPANTLDEFTSQTFDVRWGVIFGQPNGYFVEEYVAGSLAITWGPVPSKQLAYDLIQERASLFEKLIREHCPKVTA